MVLVEGAPLEAPDVVVGVGPLGQVLAVGQHHPPFAGGELFEGLEGEGAQLGQGPHPGALPAGAVGVGAVGHDGDAVALAEGDQGVVVAGQAAVVHGGDAAGAGGERRLHRLGIDGVGPGVDVHEDGDGAHLQDGGGGGDERHRRDDHLVARLYPDRLVGALQGRGAVGDGHAVAGVLEAGEGGLELAHPGIALLVVGPPPPLAAVQDLFQEAPLALVAHRPGLAQGVLDRLRSSVQGECRHVPSSSRF